MVKKAARLAFPQISIEVHTEHSQYKITNDSNNQIGIAVGQQAGVLSNSIVSFETQNSIGDNLGSCSIIVSGQTIRWDKILNVNDIIILRVNSNELDTDEPVYNTNIFTGLLSEVSLIGQYGNDSQMFQITAQSFAKAFTQFKIGLISQVEKQISNMGWLWDMNAQLDAMTYEDGGDGGGGGSVGGYLALGHYSKKLESKVRAVAKAVGGKLGIKPAFIFAQLALETGMKENNLTQHNNLSGIIFVHQKGARAGSLQPAEDGGHPYAYYKSLNYYAGDYARIVKRAMKGAKPKTVEAFNHALKMAGYYTAPESQYLKNLKYWTPRYGKGGGSGSSSSGSDSDSGVSNPSNTKVSSGQVNSDDAQIKKEQENSQGVPFFGNTAATIENNLIKRFKPYMVYSYDNNTKTLWDFLDYSNLQSWSDYEYLFDSSQFTNASGSLWDLMQNASRAPFNEMFFDSMANGQSKFVLRRTPFNPEDWNPLTTLTVDSTNLIDYEVSKTDLQQYSVFVVNPATPTLLGITDGMLLSAFPQTNLSLINYYGYSKFEVDDLYLSGKNGDNNKDDDKDKDKDGKKKKDDKKKDGKKSKGKSKPKVVKGQIAQGGKPAPLAMSRAYIQEAGIATRDILPDNVNLQADKGKSKPKKAKVVKKKPVVKEDKKTGLVSKDNSAGKPYTAADVRKYFDSIGHNTIRMNKTKYAKALADAANNISAAQAYDLVNSYCANGYILNQATYNNIMQVDSGGGLPNNGTKPASYENMNDCIKKAKGDLNAFMSIAKSTLKNVSDEFLRQVWQARDGKGNLTKKAYETVYKESRDAGNATGDAAATDLKVFTRMLYNWYADNFNFYSGTITISGNPDARVGTKVDVINYLNRLQYGDTGMRFYLESVNHKFSYTDGFTTDLGVTRGMKMPSGDGDDPRFNNLWGTSIDYKGGYMGEAPTTDLAYATEPAGGGSGDSDGSDVSFDGAKGSEMAVKIAKYAYTFRKDANPKVNGRKVKEIYSLGGHGERGNKNPLTHDINQGYLVLDCSSFVYWCYKKFGITIGTITTTQANDKHFKKVKTGNSCKNMKVGDLAFMNGCQHVMFYIGGSKFMGWNGQGSWDTTGGCKIETYKSLTVWAHLDGYVARLK